MTQLSDSQIVAKARAAGFAGVGLVQAVAHVLAESDGDSNAVSPTNDWGWFQWNARWHPEGVAVRGTDQEFALAYQVTHGGSDWHEWSTTSNGGVAKVLARAQAAVAGAPTSDSGFTATQASIHIPGVGDIPTPGDVAGAISSGVGALSKGVLVIAIKGVLVLCGVALVVLGVAALGRRS